MFPTLCACACLRDGPNRMFDASCADDNGWVAHLSPPGLAAEMAQHLADMAELHADQAQRYLPDPGRRWTEAIVLAYPDSEIVQGPAPVAEADDDGNERVY